MIVQHNLPAMNATRQLKLTGGDLQKATEKLSSGYKINRAGDNAAGLAISEKMRAQIRGLDQASNNSQDGISLIQTAEGALNETHSILQRMRELAVQAASDTNTDDDRTKIQDEISQLTQEVDRIANTTEFNTKKLLNGDQEGARVAEKGTVKVEGNFGNGSVKVEFVGMEGSQAAIDAEKAVTAERVNGLKQEYEDLNKSIDAEMKKYNALIVATGGTDPALAMGTDGTITGTWPDSSVGTAATAEQTAELQKLTNNINAMIKRKDEMDGGTDGSGTYATANVTASAAGGDAKIIGSEISKAATDKDTADKVSTATTDDSAAKDVETTDVVRITVQQGATSTGVANFDKSDPKLFPADNLFGTTSSTVLGNTKGSAGASATSTSSGASASGASSAGIAVASSSGSSSAASTSNNSNGSMLIKVGGAVLRITNADKLKAGDNITISLNEAVKPRDAANTNKDGVKLQIGANASQEMQMRINSMKADDLKISKNGVAFDVTEQTGASMAIEAYDMAIQKVSRERAKMGAIQNRLEHTIANLDTASENLSAAESRIRDTDMAKTMTQYSKNNILQQAGQSMLAQANQQTQGVLTLLR